MRPAEIKGIIPLSGESMSPPDGRLLHAARTGRSHSPADRAGERGLHTPGRRRADSMAESRALRVLSGDLDWIVMKAIDKDRHCRYASASEFGADIERYLKSEPVLAGPPGAAYRIRKFVVRHKRPVAAATAIVLALIAGIVTTTWQAQVAGQQRTEAVKQRVRAEQ